jgi:hypothetical protein
MTSYFMILIGGGVMVAVACALIYWAFFYVRDSADSAGGADAKVKINKEAADAADRIAQAAARHFNDDDVVNKLRKHGGF